MVNTNLNQLHPPAVNEAIKLRVARAWDCILLGSERIVGFAFVATDKQGNAIHVQANAEDAEIFKDLVIEGALYLIAAFRLTRANVTHVAVQRDLMMWLTKRSVLRLLPDNLSPYPRHFFELYAEENFPRMANNNAFLVDVGMVMTITQEISVEHPSEDRISRKRVLTIGSLLTTITLWDKSLDMIDVPEMLSMKPKPVVLFAGMLVKAGHSDPALTSCCATKLYVNLDLDETAMVQAIYEEMEGNVRLLPPPA
ncbi:Nucleic acid-binding protein [Corchorus capsularis]|uniref:Nucleic acid-binding protein n=1 Tax=Corchorus capsularis TaxID=210143 RepID=A0A1R3HBZ3_COCAP|nr:Nucleic acid-binding protein [Corchorus capsularis]